MAALGAFAPECRTYTPNFGIEIEGKAIAIHVWNTSPPRLEPRLVRAVLSLFAEPYRNVVNPPDDFGVLCLRTMRLIRLGDSSDIAGLGRFIAARIDEIFRRIAEETRDAPTAPGDRPTPPPPGE